MPFNRYSTKPTGKRYAPKYRKNKRAPKYKRVRRKYLARLKPEVKSQYHIQEPRVVNPKCLTYTDIYQPFPTIAQSTAQNGRIGNRIKGLNLRIAGMLTQKFVNTTGMKTTRIGVRIIVANPIKFPNGRNAALAPQATQWLPKVVDLGNDGGYLDGTCNRFYAPLNKDVLRVWADKKVILTCPFVPDQTGSDEQQRAGGLWHSVKPFKFNFNLKGSTIKYAFGSETHPVSRTPVVFLMWCCLNGETLNNTEQELTIQYRSDLFYTDS